MSVATLVATGTGGFSAREFPANEDVGDVRAADLNGDGKVDLVVTHHHPDFDVRPHFVTVIMDVFGAEERHQYDTGVPGEFGIALGDFTGDGVFDIATGNQSTYRDDDLGPQMWSSVSVLKGTITDSTTRAMTFGSPVSFRLGTVNREGYTESWNIEAADLNRDGRLDLVHAPGAVLLNRPSTPNKPPSASAGPDRTLNRENGVTVMGEASDPDGHWLDFRWSTGDVAPWFFLGNITTGFVEPGVYNFTLTVDDGQGGTSSDSVTITVEDTVFSVVGLSRPSPCETTLSAAGPYTVPGARRTSSARCQIVPSVGTRSTEDAPSRPSPAASTCPAARAPASGRIPVPSGREDCCGSKRCTERRRAGSPSQTPFLLVAGSSSPLPDSWGSRDIGPVGAAGSASFANGVFTVHGAGADIWGTADAFQYVLRSAEGDFDLVARVLSVQNVNQWTKAGLMVRTGLGDNAAHVSLFATPSTVKGVSVQTRSTNGGVGTERSRVAVAPPVWLKLMRRGTSVQPAYRVALTDPWTVLPAVSLPPATRRVRRGGARRHQPRQQQACDRNVRQRVDHQARSPISGTAPTSARFVRPALPPSTTRRSPSAARERISGAGPTSSSTCTRPVPVTSTFRRAWRRSRTSTGGRRRG